VLLLHRQLPATHVLAGIDQALGVGSVDPALVAIEARRLADASGAVVVPVTQAPGPQERPAPTLGRYDALLDAGGLATVAQLGAQP